MAEMSSLLEIFQEGGAGPKDLAHRLRSESAKPGLERFLAVLDAGIADSEGGRLGFQGWTPDQIAAVLAVARLIVPPLLGMSGEIGSVGDRGEVTGAGHQLFGEIAV
ncbi:hypothetical protein BHE74_00012920 [Ensete ventricosum]|uniref:Uncharacterized protein n=1 Tax=Ensete ventricosum TaxID=4639 RepID=A0A444G2R8_ENSVE|nr:hypothetical protein GW17_00006301 [Ensete ventricosum]RWW78835.1 hypothetical protein BHE74_00012920 [Ensete ventricosum]RZR73142.1 hypothetical protein BHM03_00020782 [Ensete ventricosum]